MPIDARISEIIVTIDRRYTNELKSCAEALTKAGVSVSNIDDDHDVIEGTCALEKVHGLKKLDFVDYVRTVFTYYADYPAGDPRDTGEDVAA